MMTAPGCASLAARPTTANTSSSERVSERSMPGAAADAVQMAVGKTRRHEATAEIDHLGGGPDMSTHRHGRAGCNEASILDGEAFGERGARVRREHLAVENDEVGGLGGGMGCEWGCERNGQRGDQTDM